MSTHKIPPYPEMSVMTNEEGTVLLLVHITTEGTVDKAEVTTSSGSLRLDEAARDFVMATWRWQPPTQDCKVIDVSTRISIKWDLKDAPDNAPQFPLIAVTKADYPAQALEKHEQGTVVVGLLLNTDGTVVRSQVVVSSGFDDLDNKAVELARTRVHWTAPKMDGVAIISPVQAVVRWQIDRAGP